MSRFRVKILGKEDRSEFVSPTAFFTRYFVEQASSAQRKGISTVYIVLDTENCDRIVGYYTLSNSAIGTDLLKKASGLSLARYDLSPTTLLGRLSRCDPSPAKGFGKALLAQAMATVALASRMSSSVALVLNPFDDVRAKWYQELGFKELFLEAPGTMMYYEMRKIVQLNLPVWPGTIAHVADRTA